MKKQIPIVIATIRPWNIERARRWDPPAGYSKVLITKPEQLTISRLKKINPRYILFPHWSWKVSHKILESIECVCFHETNVPYGRGGSPIQNLIQRDRTRTVISALRMETGLDTGPVYMKRPASLRGSAQEIYERNADIVFNMMRDIVQRQPKPKPQRGKVVVFKRRTPEQSNLKTLSRPSARRIYNFIRMLDAETYPHAFIEIGSTRIEFRNARLREGKVYADAIIRPERA